MSNLLSKASILLTPTATSDGKLHSVKPIQNLGSELVSQPNFQSQGSWYVFNDNQGTISGGTATIIGNGSNAFAQWRHNFTVSTSKKYELIVTISQTNHNVQIAAAAGASDFPSKFTDQVGTHTFRFTPTGTTFVLKIGINNNANGNATLTFASLKEVSDGDFTFTRDTSATRVNSNGLIESVASGLPRIDFLGGTGQVLLEPASTNTATYSNDFTQGSNFNSGNRTLSDCVLSTSQGTAPDGTNTAQKLTDNNNGGTGSISLNSFGAGLTSNTDSTVSMFVKKDTVRYFVIKFLNFDTSQETSFDLDTGTVNRGTGVMTNYGNGWYRCSATFSTTTDLVGAIQFLITNSSSTTGGNLRDGSNSTLVWGYQAEESSFATSYIPTVDSPVTRNKDEANNSGDTSLINSTEGVLYAEIASLADDTIERNISLSSGDTTNTVEIFYNTSTNQVSFKLRANNANITVQNTTVSDRTQYIKVALKYKSGDIEGFINGVKEVDRTDSFTFSAALSELAFDRGDGANNFEGKIKTVAVFKEALTDAQLISLTS